MVQIGNMNLETVSVQMKFKAKRLDKITERVSFNKETRAKDYIHKYSNF